MCTLVTAVLPRLDLVVTFALRALITILAARFSGSASEREGPPDRAPGVI